MHPPATLRATGEGRTEFFSWMSHRRRLIGVDYSAPGTYLLTVVTHRRRRTLGALDVSGVTLSVIGECVTEAWTRIPMYRPWVSLGAFVVMPDHWHGIVWWHQVPRNRAGHFSIIVAGMKAEATRFARTRAALRPDAPLWMRSYDVRFLNSDRRIADAERYVLENPIRARARTGG